MIAVFLVLVVVLLVATLWPADAGRPLVHPLVAYWDAQRRWEDQLRAMRPEGFETNRARGPDEPTEVVW